MMGFRGDTDFEFPGACSASSSSARTNAWFFGARLLDDSSEKNSSSDCCNAVSSPSNCVNGSTRSIAGKDVNVERQSGPGPSSAETARARRGRVASPSVSCVFLVILGILSITGAAFSAPVYPLALRSLIVSHGSLHPKFDPEVLSYSVTLGHAHDQIAITPEIDQSLEIYQSIGLPVLQMSWPGHENSDADTAAAVAVRRQIDLPDDGSALTVNVNLANPLKPSQQRQYSVTIYQSTSDPVVLLKGLEAVDEKGVPASIDPVPSQDSYLYSIYVDPDSDTFSLKPECARGNWVTLNGKSVSNGQLTSISREKDHHRQVLELVCGKSIGISSSITRRYLLSVFSDFDANAILPPRLIVNERGRDCSFDEKQYFFMCPNPNTKDYRTRLMSFSNPTIRYTLESSDGSVQVRLLDQTPSIPFTYAGVGSTEVVAVAGRFNATWPVKFNGVAAFGPMRVVGWLLGALLAVLLLSLLAVLGLSNTMGIGTPIGVSEIAHALTFLLQFFCFASALRGPNLWSDMTEALKWITFFWPLPWQLDSAHGRSSARWGDASNLENAYGCLFWVLVLFCSLMLLHGVLTLRVKQCRKGQNTFSHRMRFGNWEVRCLHWITFPAATAAGMVLSHRDATPGWRIAAGGALVVVASWAVFAWLTISNSIKSRNVVWVWQSSVREDGELEDEAGYWSDVQCDQLLSQPVNRSLFKWFFPWRWVSTVADVEPVNICPNSFARRGDFEAGVGDGTIFPVDHFHRAHKEALYPLGKNPKTVDVIRSVAASSWCPGQRLIAGLMRTQWLDILFTYEGLTKFHDNVATDLPSGEFSVPLTVKTSQLTGPITGGASHFFFDGARIPFIRIGDTLFRLVIGVMIGLTLSSENYWLDASMYGGVGTAALALLVYHIVGAPYTRMVENWILGILLTSLSTTAFSFTGYAWAGSRPMLISDIFLMLTGVTAFLLAAYAALVIFSVYAAVTCPPLEETRFLEKLANCNFTISDPEAGWAVDMPAYHKHGARDLKVQCSATTGSKVHVSIYPSGEEATLQFDAQEVFHAARSGILPAPLLCLFCPDEASPLGYKHMNVYDVPSLQTDVAGFLAINRSTRHLADIVSRSIAHHVASRVKDGKATTTNCMTIIPPKLSSEATRRTGYDDQQSVVSASSRATSGVSRRFVPSAGPVAYSSLEMVER